MNKKYSTFSLVCLGVSLLSLSALQAQQVYPVQVNASLMPPHSLILSDYASTRADDIQFIITLNDPVEPSRLVRFRLTLLNEGNPVLVTSPNYLPPPIVLMGQTPEMLNGADLAGYFNPANMVPVNGEGQAGDLLPSGYNSFCIEVIDVQRNVAISDRICANGFFELAQPPIPNLPVCGAVLPFNGIQNMTFSWIPMHQLSANTPVDVSYEFTLVKLFPGVVDPNDGFNLSTVILQRTVNQPILQYLQDDPPLEQDALYAWRVRALDGRGYNIFQNNGYSPVCSFAFEGGGQLGAPLFACNGGDCAYAEPISSSPLNGLLSTADKVKLGYFEMALTSVLPNSTGGYSGEGSIYIPYLFSKLEVEFSDIRVNNDLRVFDGAVYAKAQHPELIPPLFSSANQGTLLNALGSMSTAFADQTAQDLENYFNGGGSPNLVSTLKNAVEANAIPIGLPIGIDQQIPGSNLRTTVAVTGAFFSARQAQLHAVMAVQFGNPGVWVKFGIKGLCFHPGGLALSAPALLLLNDVSAVEAGIPLTFKGMAPNGDPGTFAAWNCEGFEQFTLKGNYAFSRDFVRPVANPAAQVSADFSITTRSLRDFMVKVDAPEDFFVTGAQDFPFHVGDIWLDFSPSANPAGLEFPENYPAASANESFRGAFITEAAVTLPPAFLQSGGGALPSLSGNNLLLDGHGMTGRVKALNLINLSTGDLGGWAYSLDSAWLNLVANDFIHSGFGGKIRLPIMQEEESLKYSGFFQPGIDSSGAATGFMDFGFRAVPDIVTISLLKAQVAFDSSSEIIIERSGGQFLSPKANLSGLLTAAATQGDPGFVGRIMEQIQALQDALTQMGLGALIPQLDIDGIRFEGMKIDLGAADKFQIEQIIPQNASFQFLGLNADLSALNFATLTAAELTQMGLSALPNVIPRALEFRFELARDLLGALSPTLHFAIVVKEEQTAANRTRYSFGGFDLRFELPEVSFNCNQNLPPIALDPSPSNFPNAPVQGDLKAGYFVLKPNYPLSSDNGSGLISGTGTVEVPILGPFRTLNVNFSNVQVDKSGRIVSGDVITGGDAGLFNSPNLSGIMANVQSQVDAMVAGMNRFNLPVVLGKKANGENERDQGLILMGLVFGPEKATAKAKIIFDPGNGNPIEFVAEGLTFVPNGIANFDLAVGLAADYPFQPISELNPLIFKAYDAASNSGSFIKMDCRGFLEFNMEASYHFSEDMLVSLDQPGEPVTATFVFNSEKWGEFMAQMQGIGRFTFPGLDGFEMSISDAYIDFSRERNIPDIQFPENYEDGGIPNEPFRWRGFYLPQLSITLPPEFALSSSGRSPSLTCEHMIIDEQGMSFSVFGNSLVDGEIGGWGFALDSVGITVVSNELTQGALAGNVNMPLMDEPMPYLGTLEQDEDGFWALKLSPLASTHFNISALKAYLDLEPSSEIVLGSVEDTLNPGKRKFRPYANLYGKIGVDVQRSDFPDYLNDAISLVENVLGEPFNFTPPAIFLYGLKINHPELPPDRKFGLDAYEIQGGISIGGHELTLEDLDMLDQPLSIQNQLYEGLGLKFDVDLSPLKFTIGIWAKKNPNNAKYSFGKITLDVNIPSVSCQPDPNVKFELSSSSTEVTIPFLSATYQVQAVTGTQNLTTNNVNPGVFPFSLLQKLQSIGSELPIDLNIPAFDLQDSTGDGIDFLINGITFNKITGTGTMNAALRLTRDGKVYEFIAALPINPKGIFFEGIKVGPGVDIGF